MHQPPPPAPAQTTPLRLDDNPGSNKHRPRRPPTDAETTSGPSHSPCNERRVLQPTRCAVHALPHATHRPPPVSGNQGLRRPLPPRTAAHSRTPATLPNDDSTYANGDVTHAQPAKHHGRMDMHPVTTTLCTTTKHLRKLILSTQDHKRRQQELGMQTALCSRCCEVFASPLHTFRAPSASA